MLRRKVSYGSDTHWLPLSTGNCWRKVSCCGNTHWLPLPTGNCWQKISCCGNTHWLPLPTGNCWRKVSCCGNTHWLPLPTGNCWRKVSCCGDALWSAIPTGNFTPERFDSGSLSFSTLRRQQKSLSAGKPTGFWREGKLLSRKSKVKMIRINAPPFLRLAAVFPFIMGI